MKLRPYQEQAILELAARFKRFRKIVAVAPTASGKTVIGAAFIRQQKGRVLWLAHRIELLRQARAQLIARRHPGERCRAVHDAATGRRVRA
jgi:superfamily II DNA or RNA helicase